MLRLCRCGKKIPISKINCDECISSQKERHKIYDKVKRDKTSSAFYHSKEWSRVRFSVLARDNNLCQECLKHKRIKLADLVDHIIPIKVKWELRLTKSNCRSLCNSCHNKKTAEDKKLYKG